MKVKENKIVLTKWYKIVTLKNHRHIYYLFFLCCKEIAGCCCCWRVGLRGGVDFA